MTDERQALVARLTELASRSGCDSPVFNNCVLDGAPVLDMCLPCVASKAAAALAAPPAAPLYEYCPSCRRLGPLFGLAAIRSEETGGRHCVSCFGIKTESRLLPLWTAPPAAPPANMDDAAEHFRRGWEAGHAAAAPPADLVALKKEIQRWALYCFTRHGNDAHLYNGLAALGGVSPDGLGWSDSAAPRVPETPQGWQPLEAAVDGHVLQIRIGVKSLANAVVLSDWAAPFNESAQDFQRTFAITDPVQFAREVLRALQGEEEDGSTLLTQLLDNGAREAIDDGADGCEFDCVISHGKRDPRETWSPAPPQEPPR